MVAPVGNGPRIFSLPDQPQGTAPATPAAPAASVVDPHPNGENQPHAQRMPIRGSAFLGPQLQQRLREFPARIKSIAKGRPGHGDKLVRDTGAAPALPAGWNAAEDSIPPEVQAPAPDALDALIGRHTSAVHIPAQGALVPIADPESLHQTQLGVPRRKPLPEDSKVVFTPGSAAAPAPAPAIEGRKGGGSTSLPDLDVRPSSVPPRTVLTPYPVEGEPAAAVMPEPWMRRRPIAQEPTGVDQPPPKEPLEPQKPLAPPPRPPKEPL